MPVPHYLEKKFFLYWVDFVVAVFFGIISVICHFVAVPYHRFFVERDPDLSYPWRDTSEQEVPTLIAFVLAVPVPWVILILWIMFWRFYVKLTTLKKDNRILDPLLATLAFAEAMAVSFAMSEFTKNFVGKKRPNFYAMCNYQGYRDALATGNFTYYEANTIAGRPGNVAYCLETDQDRVDDSQASFPSGHAACAFASLIFCGLFAIETLKHFTRRNVMLQSLFVFAGGWIALVIAATRPRDYWHDFEDILAGSLIGLTVGVFVFHMNYQVKLVPHLLVASSCCAPETVEKVPGNNPSEDRQDGAYTNQLEDPLL